MEDKINITLKYNNRDIKLELQPSFDEFINLLKDKLYLTDKMISSSTIYYQDNEGDKNILSKDNYKDSFNESNGIFELELDFGNKGKEDNNVDENEGYNKNVINNKAINQKDLKNLEKSIAKKFAKIFETKLKEKDIKHQKEILSIKKEFKSTIDSAMKNSENKYNELSDYYNEQMKINFQKYNEMIIENINKGLTQSDLNKLAEKFINDNQIHNSDDENNDDDNNKIIFSKVIKK